VALARAAAKDVANGLPRGAQLGAAAVGEYDPAIEDISPEWKLQAAREAEKAARAEDARVRKFDSTGAGDFSPGPPSSSSHGGERGIARVLCLRVLLPGGGADGQLQTASWSDTRRTLARAAAARGSGPHRRPPGRADAGRAPAEDAGGCLSCSNRSWRRNSSAGISSAVNGLLVHKKSSFLGALLGKRVAAPGVTLVDDGTLEHGIATRPFDGEGVASRRTAVIEDGCPAPVTSTTPPQRARPRRKSTGSASRAWASLPSIGTSNFYLMPGKDTAGLHHPRRQERTLCDRDAGPRRRRGHRRLLARGDGIWIENGELTWPVQEVTVSGNLLEMLKGIDAVATISISAPRPPPPPSASRSWWLSGA